MPQSRSRKITIVVLAALTLLLLGVAVFIAIRIQTPPDVSVEDCSTPGVSCDSHGCRLDKGEKWCNSSGQCISGDLPAFCADPPPTSSGGGTPPPPGAPTCVPNKTQGQACSQACGANACDGSGPLECRICTINPADAARGCRFAKEGQATCMNGASDSGACGQIICDSNPCDNASGRPNECSCSQNSQCSSGLCQDTQGDRTCQPAQASTCSSAIGRPNNCQCDNNGQCGSGLCQDTQGDRTCQTPQGGSNSCTGLYNVYQCNRFTGGAGCQDGEIAHAVTLGEAQALLNGTPTCAVRQYDCIGSSGVNLVTDERDNWNESCAQAVSTPASTPTSTPVGSAGTSNPTSNPTSAPVGYQCINMTRSPAGNPVTPGQVLTVVVNETSATRSTSSCVYLTNPDGTQLAQSGTPTNITDGPNSTHTNTYTVTVPGNATEGNDYGIVYSQTCNFGSQAGGACVQSLNLDTDAPQQPSISVVKSGATVCQVEGGATIDYTVTVTNSGAVAGSVSSVVDQLPSQVTSASQITNTVPTASSITEDTITWTGPFTVNANSSITFTYRVTFAQADLNTFTTNQLTNTVTVTYGDDNSTATFTLLTIMSCLPATGLFDEPAGLILVGLVLILAGILVNRSGLLLNLFGANMRSNDATSKIVESLLNTDEVQGDRFSRGVMAEQEKKYNQKKKK